MVLWTESIGSAALTGFGYSWFAERYRRCADRLDVIMRQEHRAGEKLFMDFVRIPRSRIGCRAWLGPLARRRRRERR
jgi:hypothetical protein